MTSDPNALLAWMRARGPGDVTARVISDSGPRAFRRRADLDVAMAALIERGDVVEVSAKPRAFRVSPEEAVSESIPGRDLPSPEQIRAKHSALMASRMDLPDEAAGYIVAIELRQALIEGLGRRFAEYEVIGQAVDDAVMDAFGCEIGVEQ